jgi:DNA-binding response OmpR family regulator
MQAQRQAAVEAPGQEGAASARAAPAAGRSAEPRPPGVLVVEDDTLIAMMVEEALEQSGFRLCGSAMSAGEALRLAEADPPDFAVVDIALGPSKAGLEVGMALARRGVAVLYASAYGVGFRQEMEDMGGRACLQKPFAAEDVPRALGVLDRLRRGEAPRRVPTNFHLFVD